MIQSDRRQVGILADRYLDVLLGDPVGTFLLLVQAPLIAAAVAGVWANIAKDDLMLYFVLCLSAFFLGAVNSSREIVKERALFLREKMFNLSVSAYLQSKYRVQAILVVVQSLFLTLVVAAFVPLQVSVVWLTLVLAGVSLCGTAVGLAVSSWVETSDKAVATVPLIVIPQILFSDMVIGEGKLSNWTGVALDIMPVRWGYEILKQLRASNSDGWSILGSIFVLGLILGVSYAISLLKLRAARY